DQIRQAFFAGRCDVYTGDSSRLYSSRAANVPPPQTADDYVVLSEIISKEPLSHAFRHGDNQFGDIVRWSQYAMIEAEEYGVSSQNVDDMLKSDNPGIKRLLGVTPGMGKALGVDEKWVYTIVKQVGNYGESFDRNLGMQSPLKIDRGLNKLWKDGGLQYAPPIRCQRANTALTVSAFSHSPIPSAGAPRTLPRSAADRARPTRRRSGRGT